MKNIYKDIEYSRWKATNTNMCCTTCHSI